MISGSSGNVAGGACPDLVGAPAIGSGRAGIFDDAALSPVGFDALRGGQWLSSRAKRSNPPRRTALPEGICFLLLGQRVAENEERITSNDFE